MRSNPADVTWFWLRRIPETAYSLAAEWASWSKLALGAIGIQLAWLLWCWRRSLARAEILAAAVAFGTFATILNFRSVEVRYFGPITVFLALGLAFATVEAAAEGLRKRRVVPSMVALGALAYWTWAVGATDPSALTTARGPDRHGVEYRAIARNVQRRWVGGEPIVVGNLPYFYTFFTSAPALSIPDAGDEFLDSYLKRYHARFLLLTEDELLSWRRSWIGKDSVGPGLRLEARPGGAFLYRQDVMP